MYQIWFECDPPIIYVCNHRQSTCTYLTQSHLGRGMDDGGCSKTSGVRHTEGGEETGEDSKSMANRTQIPTITWVYWQDLLRGGEDMHFTTVCVKQPFEL